MIISASRRCDIPSYYSKWFINRLKDGYVLVPNPRNTLRLSKISLKREDVDFIVFWTKNPISMLNSLSSIDDRGYPYYFQFTITPYGRELEENLPEKKILLETFVLMSKKIGSQRMVWRYDPIIIDDTHSIKYHIECFTRMASILKGYTDSCIISFVDNYKKIENRMGFAIDGKMKISNIRLIAEAFSQIAKENDLNLFTCAEEINLDEYGIFHGSCIDANRIERIINKKIDFKKDRNQRKACGCMESYEIGTYNSCLNGCKYCYANDSKGLSIKNFNRHNPNSPLLIGEVLDNSEIVERPCKSIITTQLSLF